MAGRCKCECGESPAGAKSNYLPGHDGKHRKILRLLVLDGAMTEAVAVAALPSVKLQEQFSTDLESARDKARRA